MQANYLLPVLARSREALEQAYAHAVEIAAKGPIPCSVLDTYRNLRDRQLALENQLIAEARQRNIMPPEQAPRSLATFGACSPGQGETKLNPKTIELARGYVRRVNKLAAQVDAVLIKAYESSPAFRQHADALLGFLSTYARAGTNEIAPPPANIALLRLAYYLGGTPWRIIGQGGTAGEGEKLRGTETSVDGRAALSLQREVSLFLHALTELGKARGTIAGADDSREPTPKWPYYLFGATTVTSIGIGLLVWRLNKREEDMRLDRLDEIEATRTRRRRRRRAGVRGAPSSEAPSEQTEPTTLSLEDGKARRP